MKTTVLMERELWNNKIRQRSDNSYFCASDLVNAGQTWRAKNNLNFFNYSQWLNLQSTKDFIQELKIQTGEEIIIKGKNKNSLSWVHPFLFIDLALAISPKLKIETYKWLYDKLIEYRNTSGDSYKKLCGALKFIETNQSKLTEHIQDSANKIKKSCHVTDWNTANEVQLKLRDKIHEYIWVFSDIIKDRETLINVSIYKAKEEIIGCKRR